MKPCHGNRGFEVSPAHTVQAAEVGAGHAAPAPSGCTQRGCGCFPKHIGMEHWPRGLHIRLLGESRALPTDPVRAERFTCTAHKACHPHVHRCCTKRNQLREHIQIAIRPNTMSSGRGFQAALRCAGLLSRAAGGRSTGFAALNFAGSALRHTGRVMDAYRLLLPNVSSHRGTPLWSSA